MKLAILSCSHHGRNIGNIAKTLGHEIVGAFDPEDDPRWNLRDTFNCSCFKTAEACLDKTQPDAALVSGKHIEIPTHVKACVDRRIPYLLDKPFSDCANRLRSVAEKSESYGIISALVLPNRATRVVQLVGEKISNGSFGDFVLYSSRLNNGPPERYDHSASYWHNEPEISGGGCWAIESSHGIDTFLQFSGGEFVSVVGAVVSNATHRREVEDLGIGLLRTENGITGIIESGYSYPWRVGGRGGDHFFRFIGTKAQVYQLYDSSGNPLIEIHSSDGIEQMEEIGHRERMENIIASGLKAIDEGRQFEPSIVQAVRILEIQDAVYDQARNSRISNGPFPLGMPAPRP